MKTKTGIIVILSIAAFVVLLMVWSKMARGQEAVLYDYGNDKIVLTTEHPILKTELERFEPVKLSRAEQIRIMWDCMSDAREYSRYMDRNRDVTQAIVAAAYFEYRTRAR